MPTIKIDNVEYDLDKLSDEAKSHLQMIQFCDQEITRINIQIAITKTSRIAYAKALQAGLPTAPIGDTLKFN